ncbi:TPA: hypothetical protein BOS_11138 [Bos taurus]|nr:TPA: hypothetical protein BOS_11138 [Bos taurus]
MARARSTDSFLLSASQAAGATGSDQRKRPRRSTSPLSSRVSHTPATCWGLKFKIGSWNIEAAPATAEALSPERDTQQMPADPAGCARLSLVKAARGNRDARPGQRRNRREQASGRDWRRCRLRSSGSARLRWGTQAS